MLKTIRNVTISVILLAVIFTAAGVTYVLVAGEEQKAPAAVLKTAARPPISIKPLKPNPKNAVSASVESIVSPVKAGSNSTLTVHTTPGSTCTIGITYGKLESKDSGLTRKIADNYGRVSWSWTVDSLAPAGKWPAKVTCKYGKKSAYVEGYLEIKASN